MSDTSFYSALPSYVEGVEITMYPDKGESLVHFYTPGPEQEVPGVAYRLVCTPAEGEPLTFEIEDIYYFDVTLPKGSYMYHVEAYMPGGDDSVSTEDRYLNVESGYIPGVVDLKSSVSKGELVLTWTPAEEGGPWTYEIEYSKNPDFSDSQTIISGYDENSVKLPLASGESLYYRVRIKNILNSYSEWSEGGYVNEFSAPNGLSAYNEGKKAILEWTPVALAKSYIVTVTDTATGKVTTKTVKTNTLTLSLKDGEYTWTVKAVSPEFGESAAVEGEAFTMDGTAPTQVTGVTGELKQAEDGTTTVVLTWNPSQDASAVSYFVEYSNDKSFKGSADYMVVEEAGVELSATPGEYLYYRITAADSYGNKSKTVAGSYGAAFDGPASVENPAMDGKKVSFAWAAVEGAKSYIVTITDAAGKVTTKSFKTNTAAISLKDGDYTWTVQAVAANGIKSTVTEGEGFLVDLTAPTMVKNLSATVQEGEAGPVAVLTWGAAEDASEVKYVVAYCTDKSFKGEVQTIDTAETTAEVPLAPGEYVYYRVMAVDAFGNMSKAVTGSQAAPGAGPASVDSPSVSGKNAKLSWAAVEGAKSYIVTITDAAGKVTTKSFKTNSGTVSLKDGDYTWEVQAVTAAGIKSGAKGGKKFRIDTTAPTPVTNVRAAYDFDVDGSMFARVKWDVSKDASAPIKYIVQYSTDKSFKDDHTVETDGFHVDLPVTPGSMLYFRITAKDPYGNMSKTVRDEYLPPVMSPGFMNAAEVEPGKVVFSWGPVQAGRYYKLRISNALGVVYEKELEATIATVELPAGGYTWEVVAYTATGASSAPSKGEPITIGGGDPLEVTGLTGKWDGTGVHLAWSPTGDASSVHYVVEYSKSSTFSTISGRIDDITDTEASLKLSSLDTLYYRVMAVDASDNRSDWASGSFRLAPNELVVVDEDTVGFFIEDGDVFTITVDKPCEMSATMELAGFGYLTPDGETVGIAITKNGSEVGYLEFIGHWETKIFNLNEAGTYQFTVSAKYLDMEFDCAGCSLDVERVIPGSEVGHQYMTASSLFS